MAGHSADGGDPWVEPERERLLRRNRELSVLNTIAEGLNRAVDLREALHTALVLVTDLLGLRTGWVWLVDEQTAEPELITAQHLPPALRDDPSRMSGMCYCLRTFLRGDLSGAANVNVVECSRLQGLVAGTEGLHFHASIPIYAGPRRLGVMNLAAANWRELTSDELQLLYTIGYQIGVAVERARLHARAAQAAAMEERLRLARDLHDALAQSIAAIGLHLEAADTLLDRTPKRTHAAHEKVREALRLTRDSLQEVRAIVHNLRSPALGTRPLPEALRALAAEYARTYGLSVEVRGTAPTARLTPMQESQLFRVAQEALTNVAKHAAAHRVWVRLTPGPHRITLSVRDDGRGFIIGRPASGPTPGGYGLKSMADRVRLLGGVLRVRSQPGRGTTVTATVPVEGGES
jgi:two-component system NarL family sensor kinase